MRRMIVLGLVAAFSGAAFAHIPWTAGQPGGHSYGTPHDVARGSRPGGWEGLARDELAADTDVLHYNLDIEIDPNTEWLGGSNTMTVRSVVNGLSHFRFRLHNVFTITAMTVNGTAVSWVQLDTATVEVTLDRAYEAGEIFDLYVAYEGYPIEGMGFVSVYMTSSRVFTISEPWFAYTWWPSKDDLLDKTTADLFLTVPDYMTVASNGVLQGVAVVNGQWLRYHWVTQYLTEDYLYCVGASNYNTFDAVWDSNGVSMPLQFFIFPGSDTPENRAAWLACSDMLTVFSELYGMYPFVDEKYGIYQFSNMGFSGMEHQTMTGQSGFWESLTAHELAHQWWGDSVTCATWHDIWLHEGFATYSEALWEEYKPGSSGEPALHEAMAARYPDLDSRESVYVEDISNYYRVFDYNLSYLKAAWVLHMFRHVVGDEAFFEILAAYRAAFEGSAATTEDFRAVAELVTGRDLYWFFDQWIYSPARPIYQYAWQQHVLDGQRYVELLIRQMQWMGPPCFVMPVDIVTHSGADSAAHVVWNDAQQEHLLFPVGPAPVDTLEFDPVPWILRRETSETSFIEGPPKIVAMTPAPGETLTPGEPVTVEVVFHKDVQVDAAALSFVGQVGGPVSTTFSYDPARHAVTLTPTGTLERDVYTLTVSDSIVDTAAGLALDGELSGAREASALPSGDGLPGGAAVAQFAVAVMGDMDCDGDVDGDDVTPFVVALGGEAFYFSHYPACWWMSADCNGDGQVDFDDINPFVALLGD